ncbi:MAG: hypothetical protein GC146_10680 [Limimaricola sp.]|uniref:hypothetical protein n=1 Tax=Limimaricola sp. TaxID=2211665 RepID=UPI001D86D510|nr:hypothetical protein [Limimaricola sp.]MBI1417675.1 hypothetical protein [Limimaricola sp.]
MIRSGAFTAVPAALFALAIPACALAGEEPVSVQDAYQTFIDVCLKPEYSGVARDAAFLAGFGLTDRIESGTVFDPVRNMSVRLYPPEDEQICSLVFKTTDDHHTSVQAFVQIASQLNPEGKDEAAWVGRFGSGDAAAIQIGGKPYRFVSIVPREQGWYGLKLVKPAAQD